MGGGFRMGNTCTPVADACWCMAKPIQYCKVNNNNKINVNKKCGESPYSGKWETDHSQHMLFHTV